ncbi:MAG: glutathione S-transferase family protein [Hyphomicrobiaceae bacterium]
MLRVLGKASSINVRKVLWMCDEIGQPFALEESTTDTAEFRALNPNGLVPVIVDGDFVLWESNTIIRYLANKSSAATLYPVEARARAQIDQWIDWQATEFNTSWRYAFQALVRKSPAHANVADIEASVLDWSRTVAIVDEQLSRTGGFIAGPAFTLADIPTGLSVNRWIMTPIEPRPSFPAVAAYYERLSGRRGFMRHGRNGIP